MTVTYREDDGLTDRLAALLRLAAETPGPTLAALARDPRATLALAPAAGRLRADPGASLAAAGPDAATAGSDAPPAGSDAPPAGSDGAGRLRRGDGGLERGRAARTAGAPGRPGAPVTATGGSGPPVTATAGSPAPVPVTTEGSPAPIRAAIVDPSAYTPAYDHALSSALARAGASVQLVTSRFAYGEVPAPDGYVRQELFYRRARGDAGSRARRLSKLASHPGDMRELRRLTAATADVVHFQWLAIPWMDARAAAERAAGADRSRPAPA